MKLNIYFRQFFTNSKFVLEYLTKSMRKIPLPEYVDYPGPFYLVPFVEGVENDNAKL